MSKERLYTKEDVSTIVRDRVKGLNERIEQLELENAILRLNERVNQLDE